MVFGRVTEGQGLLQKLNAVGTRSGKPKQRVVIVDCGELPSKRQIMLKLQVCAVTTHHFPLSSHVYTWLVAQPDKAAGCPSHSGTRRSAKVGAACGWTGTLHRPHVHAACACACAWSHPPHG